MTTTQPPQHINYESVVWMQEVPCVNNKNIVRVVGIVTNNTHPNTLLVSEKGTGLHLFYCQKHQFTYELQGKCAECQNQVVTTDFSDPPKTISKQVAETN